MLFRGLTYRGPYRPFGRISSRTAGYNMDADLRKYSTFVRALLFSQHPEILSWLRSIKYIPKNIPRNAYSLMAQQPYFQARQ
jgi:hypothetical protein